MRILLVYPEIPDTFWSFKYALKFVSKKAAYPPLGLLTVAAMLPEQWEKKLVDMNVEKLRAQDIRWADLVLISAMSLQSASVKSVVAACKQEGVKIAAGGPLFTAWPEKYEDIDYLVLGEAELTLPEFLKDFEAGCAGHLYTAEGFPDITQTPKPLWSLIDMKNYASMNLQYSRGCPFNCDFCDIIVLFGHKPRLKTTEQIIGELELLYDYGWRGGVFFVDDNFIGNKQILKTNILPAIIDWSEKKGRPFSFHTEASLNISDDDELMELMVKAGFEMVFVGIESPNEESLAECNKLQNKNRDILACIEKIQKKGMEVEGGFILGFDSDPDSIFDTLIRFIQQSGIVVAMVGLLNAPRGTKLFERLSKEQRLTSEMSGDNTDYSINFVPRMDSQKLMSGYHKVLHSIYSPRSYYQRIGHYLQNAQPAHMHKTKIQRAEVGAFFKSVWRLGILGKERLWYWKLLLKTTLTNRAALPRALTFAIYGYHFRKIYKI